MIQVYRYNQLYKEQWDELVSNSKNGTFLFYREYLEYHSDRFTDSSFLIFKKDKLICLLPGNIDETTFYSHQGLTYGGIILSSKLGTKEIIEVFKNINDQLKKDGIKEVVYKPIPYIYHKAPSQEDIYALFLLGAVKIACNISSTIYQHNKIQFIESRKGGVRKSRKSSVKISESNNFESFWEILNTNLSNKFNTKAVHTVNEISYLHSKFPQNIRLYIAEYLNNVVAGTVIYEMSNIVHVQYISASEKGKEIGALDLLFDELINKIYISIPIFDFGQSTLQMGAYLNENLIFQKEGFGGRGVVYEIYKYKL